MKPVFLAACGAKTYETLKNLCLPQEVSDVDYRTGIIRFFTKQIATEGSSTVFGQWRCAL